MANNSQVAVHLLQTRIPGGTPGYHECEARLKDAQDAARRGDLVQAISLLRKNLEWCKTNLPNKQQFVITVWYQEELAGYLAKQGNYTEALVHIGDAYDIRYEADREANETLETLHQYATILAKLKQYGFAARKFETLRDIQKVKLGENHPITLNTGLELASCWFNHALSSGDNTCKTQNLRKARDLHKHIIALLKSKADRDDILIATTREDLASDYLALGEYEAALELAKKNLSELDRLKAIFQTEGDQESRDEAVGVQRSCRGLIGLIQSRQERKALREQEVREQATKEQERRRDEKLRKNKIREQKTREQELREQELREQQIRDQEAEERQLREAELQEASRQEKLRKKKEEEVEREREVKRLQEQIIRAAKEKLRLEEKRRIAQALEESRELQRVEDERRKKEEQERRKKEKQERKKNEEEELRREQETKLLEQQLIRDAEERQLAEEKRRLARALEESIATEKAEKETRERAAKVEVQLLEEAKRAAEETVRLEEDRQIAQALEESLAFEREKEQWPEPEWEVETTTKLRDTLWSSARTFSTPQGTQQTGSQDEAGLIQGPTIIIEEALSTEADEVPPDVYTLPGSFPGSEILDSKKPMSRAHSTYTLNATAKLDACDGGKDERSRPRRNSDPTTEQVPSRGKLTAERPRVASRPASLGGMPAQTGSPFDATEEPVPDRSVDRWFNDIYAINEEILAPFRRVACKRVKIAILDTGVDMNNTAFLDKYVRKRIKKRVDFVDKGGDATDVCGHGTHCVSLLNRIAPAADIYVGRVAVGFEKGPDAEVVAQAIRRALRPKGQGDDAENWDVDILALSLGFSSRNKTVKEAIEAAKRRGHGKLVFAAAANSGTLRSMAFPASMNGVIAINSATATGAPSGFNPRSPKWDKTLTVLGEAVVSAWTTTNNSMTPERINPNATRRMTGTSVATPIAAGIAALLLELTMIDMPDEEDTMEVLDEIRPWLKGEEGMMAVLMDKAVPTPGGYHNYHNIVPQKLLDPNWPEDRRINRIANRLRDTLSEHFGDLRDGP